MDSFGAKDTLTVGTTTYGYYRLGALTRHIGVDLARLPRSLRILLENLLRTEDGVGVRRDDIEALAKWRPDAIPDREIAFMPSRVLLQDFTGVPAVVDLAAMRDAMAALGGDPARIDPLQPVELVIDHSVQVDAFGSPEALGQNLDLDYARNRERYAFLRWGQRAFKNFRVVPPNTGICHQVNLEHLARVVFTSDEIAADQPPVAYFDTLVGTDSHTPMVNGLGVLGWGVGGIEAEAAMLGQPISMLIPRVVGFRLSGRLREGSTATDLVLTVTERLRRKGVVGQFVEFFGPGVAALPLADRATISNMSPEFGATCTMWPIDAVTLAYLRFTGRSEARIALVEAYARAQGVFHDPTAPEPDYSDVLELDLGDVVPSIAGPRRPQDRVPLPDAARSFHDALPGLLPKGGGVDCPVPAVVEEGGTAYTLPHGAVVIAAITSCTNTSNPSVMVAAGLLAKKAVEKGLTRKPWVKTSLAPGSQVVTDYYEKAGLTRYLDELGFNVVGYGCTTCIGNSGPLPEEISEAVARGKIVVASVLSGNRNFEGRIHPEVRANYLMSPPLVVAFALAGRVDLDLTAEPLGAGSDGQPVFLRDIWPSQQEVRDVMDGAISSAMYQRAYGQVYAGDERWNGLAVPDGDRYAWEPTSTYVRQPPYFDGMSKEAPETVDEIRGARCIAVLGDSITTDHISPAGTIKASGPAGRYLVGIGVPTADFNTYGARRGNHEVMMRGTFANTRIQNRMVPDVEGGFTRHLPSQEVLSIYDAACRYTEDGVPLVVIAGKEYGSGSSRDWAAKGPMLQNIRAVLAESYERIHRSNLVGMGILPLQFRIGESATSHALTGEETFEVLGLADLCRTRFGAGRELVVRVTRATGESFDLHAVVRIDTPQEVAYYRHGGILRYVLRQLLAGKPVSAERGGVSGGPSGASPAQAVDESGKESFPGSDPPAW